MKRLFHSAVFISFIAIPAEATVDENTNGLSDLWEKIHNDGLLFPASFDPNADPDGDGWTNLEESISGTNPFDANPPGGFLIPAIERTPGNPASTPPTPQQHRLTWPTLAGKTYQVFCSTNLLPDSWVPGSDLFLGSGGDLTYDADALLADGSTPPAIFWRVAVSDTNTDTDNLNNWEESLLGTNSYSPDTDLDGIADDMDSLPFDSATYADPDWLGLGYANLLTGLRANWDFEEASFPAGSLFGKFNGIARNRVDPMPAAWPMLVPLATPAERPGFVSKGIPLSIHSAFGDAKVFQGITNGFTLSFWHKFEKGSINSAIYQCLWSLCESRPNTTPSTIKSNTLAIREKSATEEEIYLGAYTWSQGGGNPNSSLGGVSFTRPKGTADDGQWHQYTIIRSNGKYTLLIDGEVIPAINNTTVGWQNIPMALPVPTHPLDYQYDWNVFGRMAPNLPQNQTTGTFDRIRLWDHALNSTETTALYRENTDKDPLWDVTENRTILWRDTNSNAQLDTGETNFRSHPLEWQNEETDTDGDGLSDKYEQDISKTDIANPDTDGDLLPDGWEVDNNLDPNDPTGINGASGDREPDGVTNLDEYRNVSDPNATDTDNDGTSDADEINGPDGDPETDDGSNPNDASDGGQQLPPEERLTITLGIGDESDSESEDYVMHVFRIDPASGQETRFYTLRSGGFGQYKERPLSYFRKGDTYTFQIDWQGTNNGTKAATQSTSAEGPDFDYTFKVEPPASVAPLLIDSWQADSKQIDESKTLLAAEANDVAETEEEFRNDHENRRVVLPGIDITAVFAEGPDVPLGADQRSSRKLLEDHLDVIKVKKAGKIWIVSGKDTSGKARIYGVETADTQEPLLRALGTKHRIVVFDGHSNYGFGPDFNAHPNLPTRVHDFTNFGTGVTSVPLNFRYRGTLNPMIDESHPDWNELSGHPFPEFIVPANEIPGNVTNFIPPTLADVRFENNDGVGDGDVFQKQGQGKDTFHYNTGPVAVPIQYLMVNAPGNDLPADLRYKTFFYNACTTGNYYIGSFQHGNFIYTNQTCFVHQATRIFVEMTIKGGEIPNILGLLNQPNIGSAQENNPVYEFQAF